MPTTLSTPSRPATRRANWDAKLLATPVTRTTLPMSCCYLPSRRRCTRVRLSILRCFFFDIRLRRFLMTEPTGHYSIPVVHAMVAVFTKDDLSEPARRCLDLLPKQAF